MLLAVDLDLGAAVLAEEDAVALLDLELGAGAVVQGLAGAEHEQQQEHAEKGRVGVLGEDAAARELEGPGQLPGSSAGRGPDCGPEAPIAA